MSAGRAAATTITDDQRELLESVATRIVNLRMAVPAMMALETVSPMNMVSASMLHVLGPMLRLAVPGERLDMLTALLEQRGAIPEFIRVIDVAEDRRRAEDKAQTAARKAERQASRERRKRS